MEGKERHTGPVLRSCELRSWVQILALGPFLSTRKLRFTLSLILSICPTKSVANENNHNLVLAVFTTLVSGVLTSFSSFIQN
jgi:hypothetical protein